MTIAVARALIPAAEQPLARLIAPFVLLHVAMFAYDMQHPERFFYADRAADRIVSMDRLLAAWQGSGDVLGVLTGRGVIGDWLPHAVLHLTGGMTLVVLAQVLLALVSIACVRRIGLRLGLDEARASGAAALYGLLPHTLVYPHQLASEAIFVPLIVISFAMASGLAMGAAILIRPVAALWPFVQKGMRRADWRYVGLALIPLLLWMSFVKVETGEFSIGKSHADLGSNLYQRTVRMTAHLPPGQRVEGRGSMGAFEYVRFSLAHPKEAAAHHGRDLATLFFKSGIERIALDYLDLFPERRSDLQKSSTGWRKQLELHGPVAALKALLEGNAALTLISIAGAIAFTVLMLLALKGVFARSADPRLKLVLAAFVIYIFATAQAVDAAASRHRAPCEFAICLLAVLALARKNPHRGHPPGKHPAAKEYRNGR
jgi:hypothetical protein